MFDFKKVQDGLVSLVTRLEDHQRKSLKVQIMMAVFTKIVADIEKDNDLIASAKMSSKIADIIMKEIGE